MEFRWIMGLGNPGQAYANTLHNVGFWVLDALSGRSDWRSLGKSQVAEWRLGSRSITLIKPQTFMNRSGEVLKKMGVYAEQSESLLVIHDDADLVQGRVKVKLGGSPGGHNGLRSIDARLGTTHYHRLRIGVGKSEDVGLADHVLKSVSKSRLTDLAGFGVEALDALIRAESLSLAQQDLHGKNHLPNP